MLVSFDTNMIVRDFWLRSKESLSFFDILEKHACKVILPSVVFDEVVVKYEEKLTAYGDQLKAGSFFNLKNLPSLDVKALTQEYSIFIHEKLYALNREHSRIQHPDNECFSRAYERVLRKVPPAR